MRAFFILIITVLILRGTGVAATFDPKEVYRETAKSVVLITASDPGMEYKSMGTGSIIRPDGLVITNTHIIFNDELSRPYTKISVYLKPDRLTGNLKTDTSKRFAAVLINYSIPLDLAVLKIQQPSPPVSLPFLQFANSGNILTGEPVVAIGHPEHGGVWSLTTGTISAQIENFQNIRGKHVFQTETSINRGNSGGPLLDKNGLLVGINSNISREGDDGTVITGINFSIQSNVAVNWLNSIGYSYDFARQPANSIEKPAEKRAGIVPVPSLEKPATKAPDTEKPAIIIEPRPFKQVDLFKQTENEMEDMMQEMQGKLRRTPNKKD